MLWLFKEEPESYSYDDLVRDRETSWEGVKNNLALKYLRQVKKGDQIFFYQTGDDKSVVGIMKALGDAYSNEKGEVSASKDIGVKVGPVKKLQNPVSLHEIKASPRFKDFLLVKISRLSIMPV
ncbi:MAG: EVE domain-containing protein, partial [Thaumarchaeota archaeon]|nr:EVE domain-containing protein [Nitrososphaerota archaeon]